MFVVTFSDEEIELIRKAAVSIGRTFSNVLHGFVLEMAERTLEDCEMLEKMAEERDQEYVV